MNAAPNPLLVPRILWAALLLASFVYLYVWLTVAPAAPETPIAQMPIALGVAALMCAIVSFVLPASLHRKAAAAAKLEVKEIPDPNASVMFRDNTPMIRVFANPAEARKKAMALYFTPLILSLALTEAIAIYGLVLGFQGWGAQVVLPFFVAAWLLFLPRFPRMRAAVGPFEKAQNAKLVDDAAT